MSVCSHICLHACVHGNMCVPVKLIDPANRHLNMSIGVLSYSVFVCVSGFVSVSVSV